MRFSKKWFGLVVLLMIFGMALYAGERIKCLEDHCGANCPYGTCVDAETCAGCVITGCLMYGIRQTMNCTSYLPK